MVNKIISTVIQVRRDTLENWNAVKDSFIPAVGEPCLVLDNGKVKYGDGVKTWGELPYSGGDDPIPAQVFQVTANSDETDDAAIVRVTDGKVIANGDSVIVSHVIAEDKVSKTAYEWNGSAWAAFDGNYSADNVYFAKDFEFSEAFGRYKPDGTGMVTVPAAAKNMSGLLDDAFSQEKNPSITQPTANLTVTGAGAKEAGTNVTIGYTASLTAGNYQYGPATGITAKTYSVVFDTQTLDTATGTFDAVQVIDGFNKSVTATITYDEGAMPITNKKNEYAAGQIKAGSKSKTTGSVTAYRNTFYGTLTDKSIALDSAAIRGLTGKSGSTLANGSKFTITLPAGTQSVVFAYPATLRDVNLVTDTNGLGAAVTSAFTKSTIDVEGANGYSAISYKVYRTDFANPTDTANTYNVTI